jgi:acyl-CoA thioesterase
VAQHCQISYLSPGRLGMRLTAEARERHRGERSGIYDVTVKSETGDVIAEFRGHSRSIPGVLVPEG